LKPVERKWYAGVNYGFEKIICDEIRKRGGRITETLDGAVVFSSRERLDLRCFVNLFIVISEFVSGDIADAVKRIPELNAVYPNINDGASFRLIIMERGRLRSAPEYALRAAERHISRKTGMRVCRANPDVEIWLNRRGDKHTHLLERAGKRADRGKTLRKGELRPDIAETMIIKADLKKNCVVADFFGGWGAVAAEMIERGGYDKIFTGDIEDKCVDYQKARFKNARGCFVQKWDACSVPLDCRSVDAVITDPPWGEFSAVNIEKLYDGFVKEAVRVLRPGGSLVFLSSEQDISKRVLEKYGLPYDMTPTKINGKTAYLFSAVKRRTGE